MHKTYGFYINELRKLENVFKEWWKSEVRISQRLIWLRLCESHSVVSNPLSPHGPYSLWNSPGQSTGVGSLSLLQGIFPTQGSNTGLPHCRQILYQLSHKGSPRILEWVAYPFSCRSSCPRNWTGVSCIAGNFLTNWAIREYLRLCRTGEWNREKEWKEKSAREILHNSNVVIRPPNKEMTQVKRVITKDKRLDYMENSVDILF